MSMTQEDNLIIQSHMTSIFLLELVKNNFLESDFYLKMDFINPGFKEKISEHGIDNQGALLMILYSLLVIPKQLINDKFPEEFKNINQMIHSIKIEYESNYSSDIPEVDYLNHIRNAIAHARVVFDPNVSVTFEDKFISKNEKGNLFFMVKIPLNTITSIIDSLRSLFGKYIKSLG